MLAAGVPDGGATQLPGELARLLEDDVAWGRLTAEEAGDGAHAREGLRASLPAIAAAADELASLPIAPSIQHDDLHGGNILVGPEGDRIFDWGDGVVAHPFSTLTVTFNSIAHKTGRELGDPVFEPLRDAYLEAWEGVASREALLRAVALARDFACIGRALAWERALSGLEADEMDDFGDSVAGWLVEFAGRLDGATWAGAVPTR
jgi:aminoglycoside phosphotransferase (APT) family kinase protein